ncbi:OB-fold protein [Polaribacter uvawellassae]|uniref:OB-fold protein n=1 Tax=Polaribacter uvawellassae TaxID=3133495 RepID=UPI00321BBF68
MNKRKILILAFIFVLFLGIFGYNYIYKDHRNISAEKAEFTLNTTDFIKEFNTNSKIAITKYLDKTIQLKGKVTEVEQSNFMLDDFIVCYTDSLTLTQIQEKSIIIVKGRNIGYDELLEYIKLDQVTFINN